MKILMIILASIAFIASVIAGIFWQQNLAHQAAFDKSLLAPSSWRMTAEEDKLVKGICLGSGSECGYIRREFITGSNKEKGMETGLIQFKRNGWDFGTPQLVRDELQVSARQKGKLLYMTVREDKAIVQYEENH